MRSLACYADVVLFNGNVVTVDARPPRAEAVAVRDGRFLAVGADRQLRELIGPETLALDLGRRTVTPGLIDAHAHLDREGLKYLYPSLAGARSIADLLERVRQTAARKRPGEWVVTMPLGTPPWYFDGPEELAEGRGPNRWELDSVAPDHPIYLRGPWGAWNKPPLSSFANSLALRRAGVGRDTPPPAESVEIERDPATGEPTGVFREHSRVPILELTLFREVPRFTPDDRVRALRHSMALYAAAGTTSIYEGHGVAPEVLRAYRALRESGEQTVRAHLVLSPTWASAQEAERILDDWLAYADGTGSGDDLLRIGGVFVPLGGRPEIARAARAALPYTAWAGFVEQCYDIAEFRALAEAIVRHGLRLNTTVHERLDEVLDVLEAIHARAPLRERQVVLQHLRVASPTAIARIKRFGAAVTTVPASYLWKEGAATLAQCGDGERILPHRDLLEAGIPFALSTDNKPHQPLFTFWAALARTDRTGRVIGPGQAISREEGLRALTIHGARLTFEEHRKGSITPGKLADLVVFGRDPLSAPPDELPDLPVDLTMIGGQVIHRSAAIS